MYKKSSENLQNRARNKITQDRSNSAGVDETSFRLLDELEVKRLELVEKKKECEIKLGKLTLQVKIAKDRYYRNHIDQVDFVTYERMEQQRMNLLGLMRDIETRLHEIKLQKRQSEPTLVSYS